MNDNIEKVEIRHDPSVTESPLLEGSIGANYLDVVDDPWKHRSKGMRCATCMWFAPKGDPTLNKKVIGRCRRHAPTMNGYPVVYENDWCGDHKLDETK